MMDEDIECDPLGEVFCDLDGNKFYTSLKVKGLHVHIGSFVKVILECNDDNNNELDSYGYCQILSIYDKVSTESDQGVVHIEVRWLLEPYEVRRVKKIGIELSDDELLETDHLDDIPAGAICDIINISGYNNKSSSSSSSSNSNSSNSNSNSTNISISISSNSNSIPKNITSS